MEEIWKDIPGYENHYKVSDMGRVISTKFGKERQMKLGMTKEYDGVGLTINGKQKYYFVHVLVAIAFLGHVPDGHNITVDHIIDGNKRDNRLCNLQLLTNRENVSKSTPANKKSGLPTGVCRHRSKYIASIKDGGPKIHLGTYSTVEEASEAYQKALAKILEK